MKKLLIVCYGGGHVKIFISMYKDLKKNFELTILALTTAKEELNKENIPFKDLDFYYHAIKDTEDIKGLGGSFINRHKIDTDKIGEKDSTLYYGYNVRDYIELFGENDLDSMYKLYGRSLFLPLITMKKIIKFEKPHAILTTKAPRFERAALLASRELGIPNFSIENLLGNLRKFSIKEDEKYGKYYGDYVFVFNEKVKKILTDRKVEATEIIASGQPAFQGIADFSCSNEQEILLKLSIPSKHKIILWATQRTEENNFIFEKLVAAFSKVKDQTLIIKPHPNQDIKLMLDQLELIKPTNIKLIRDIEIWNLIKVSDVLLTQFSTCGLEAVLMNKPLIVLRPHNKEYDLDYSKLGIALIVKEISAISSQINRYFDPSDSESKKILKNIRTFSMSNNCNDIITNFIKKKLGE